MVFNDLAESKYFYNAGLTMGLDGIETFFAHPNYKIAFGSRFVESMSRTKDKQYFEVTFENKEVTMISLTMDMPLCVYELVQKEWI